MFVKVAITVALAAAICWHFGFYHLEDITSTIKNGLNNAVGNSKNTAQPAPSAASTKEDLTPPSQTVEQPTRLLSKEEMGHYNGKEGSRGLYLAVYGQVFDVEKGARHYGPGGGYEFFSGRDATRAFVTGEFNEEGLGDDVEDFSPKQMMEVNTWVEFYKKEYTHIGKVVGRFYDANGEPTEAYRQAEMVLEEGRQEKDKEDAENRRYPPCNSSWNQQEGSKVWCSDQSGGIVRGWVGLPRRYFLPGSKNWKCVCVHDRDLSNPHMKVFEGCGPSDISCKMN
ncbi:neuferricin-like [Asterias amurensis]|uniref:neuferricin-like n=1 Tax=Asterias amurensis TaxID=7602 RepID=UPI003AB58381